ncbi:glycosyl hydrolase 5 family protein-like [Vigna unguiculata]|uniref:glycosyl hydrolase 5 family protein-like n=1 Tax=Vigna unguiculata TaxID=3917 RepID=UPI0010161F17|nr:glycosyl hydrolase 5 family protein-like [Vigna unguiculata]
MTKNDNVFSGADTSVIRASGHYWRRPDMVIKKVVEMSLRNELHGPRQNLKDWYRYMSQGAVVIHKTNPNVLVLISGLNYDTELQFLRRKPLNIDLEFGFNKAGSSVEDNKFLTCLQTYLLGKDLDWGLRAFQGTYYLKKDQVQGDESFGVMDETWHNLRYPNFTDKFRLLQRKNLEPNSNASIVNILYQPLSGQCAQVNDKNEVELGSCETKNKWVRGEDTTKIILHGSKKCLTTVGEGLLVVVFDCERNNNSWKFVSLSKLHLATLNQHEEQVCL